MPIEQSSVAPSSTNTQIAKSEEITLELKERLAKRFAKEGSNGTITEELWKCSFKKGQLQQEFYFWYENDPEKAQLAAREYCQRFKYRFIWISPFCVDIHSVPKTVEDQGAENNIVYK